MSQPQALNCPNCGGAVSSDKTVCEFCRSRLKTVACPACVGMMFAGSRFCTHCGAKAGNIDADPSNEGGNCPRCRKRLDHLQIAEISVCECEGCGGFWTTPETFERLCSSGEQQAVVLSFIRNNPHEATLEPVKYVPCPDCGKLMNRSNFARSSGIIIDLCKAHGVWFDAQELPKIIEFVGGGGLQRSREKEKIALADERAKLRDEQRRMAMMERRSGGARISNDDGGSGFGKIISSLFDI